MRWSNWSWSTTLDPSVSDPHYAGTYALGVTYGAAWGGLSLRTTSLDLMPYTTVEFALYAPGNPSLRLYLTDTAGAKGTTVVV